MSQIFLACHSGSRSFIDLLRSGSADRRQIFCSTYGRGLRFLTERACSGDAAIQCFDAVMTDSIAAILRGDIQNDDEIPQMIRETLHRTLSALDGATSQSQRLTATGCTKLELNALKEMHLNFGIFTLPQREALKRFYLDGEPASSICEALDLRPEQFGFIRLIARLVVRMNLKLLSVSGKRIRKSSSRGLRYRIPLLALE